MEAPVVVVGAGPAGLAAARALAGSGRPSLVLEATGEVGGISRTVTRNGYRFDLGGHRFFTKFDEVQRLWEEVLGPDLLVRPRMSRILYRGRFFDYPLRASNALANLGPIEAARCIASWAVARATTSDREAATFEDWVTARFGRRLFGIFFKTYSEKVWGVPCTEIAASWAAQRIRNLSLGRAAWNAIFGSRGDVTSLIERFHYPRLGPGMMYERMAQQVETAGGSVRLCAPVEAVRRDGMRATAVLAGGREVPVRHLISSMPLTDLVRSLDPPAPDAVRAAADALVFRSMMTVNLIVDRAALFPDNWIYVHSPELKVARIQNFGNWSPEMVPVEGTSAIALEYMTSPHEALWAGTDEDAFALGRREAVATGLLRDASVTDGMVVRIPHAYPVYRIGYERHLDVIADWLRGFSNLQPVGRGGMFKYNNADHSILTGLLAIENLDGAAHDLWAVNTDSEYQEVRKNG
ncbi:MAG: NAD(P)/FAD-dependent oxidoreductase [Deltaproteobacteria bacterium]|nr:NAD(P)/FAD-dependent oxidoreductase [Deltaproteobacteria bacterium]